MGHVRHPSEVQASPQGSQGEPIFLGNFVCTQWFIYICIENYVHRPLHSQTAFTVSTPGSITHLRGLAHTQGTWPSCCQPPLIPLRSGQGRARTSNPDFNTHEQGVDKGLWDYCSISFRAHWPPVALLLRVKGEHCRISIRD